MPQINSAMSVRHISPVISLIDIRGDVTMFVEQALMEAYLEAVLPTTRTILLNFSEMNYMNSSGIGLLIVLLRRANCQQQRLFSYGLNEHYRHILTLTRISDLIPIYTSEAEALAAVD